MAYSWMPSYSTAPDPLAFMQPAAAPQQRPTPPATGVQWVGGEQEARNWMVAPNSAVVLWDSNIPAIYLKTADPTGRPDLKIFDLVERTPPQPAAAPPAPDYITRDEFKALAEQVARLQNNRSTKKKEDESNG